VKATFDSDFEQPASADAAIKAKTIGTVRRVFISLGERITILLPPRNGVFTVARPHRCTSGFRIRTSIVAAFVARVLKEEIRIGGERALSSSSIAFFVLSAGISSANFRLRESELSRSLWFLARRLRRARAGRGGGLKSALLGPGVFGPSVDEAGFDGVLADVGDATLPLGVVSHPTIKPFPLPKCAGAAERGVNAAGRPALDRAHYPGQRGHAIRRRDEERMPVIGHDGIVRHIDVSVAKRAEFVGDDFGGGGRGQPGVAVTGVEILLHREKILPLKSDEPGGARIDGSKRRVDFG